MLSATPSLPGGWSTKWEHLGAHVPGDGPGNQVLLLVTRGKMGAKAQTPGSRTDATEGGSAPEGRRWQTWWLSICVVYASLKNKQVTARGNKPVRKDNKTQHFPSTSFHLY